MIIILGLPPPLSTTLTRMRFRRNLPVTCLGRARCPGRCNTHNDHADLFHRLVPKRRLPGTAALEDAVAADLTLVFFLPLPIVSASSQAATLATGDIWMLY